MNNAQLSKSAKRRLRLKQAAATTTSVVVRSAPAPVPRPGQGRSRSARRRRALAKSRGMGGMGARMVAYGGRNEYLASLMDPENISGVKVPDLTAVPTGTFQLEQEFLLTTSADGTAAFNVNPHVSSVTGNLYTSTTASTQSAIVYASNNWTANATILANYSYVRPVSGVVMVDFVGPTTSDGGMIAGFWLARNISGPTTVASAASYPLSETLPLKYGQRILWRPQDNADSEFGLTTSASNTNRPQIGFVAFNAAASSACIRVRCFFNFEGIPTAEAFDVVHPEPSPINLKAVEDAYTWGQTVADKITTLLPYASAAYGIGRDLANYWYGGKGSLRPPYQRRLEL